jgi:Trp operon repressor
VQALAALTAPAELAALLEDLLTPAETEALGERWEIVKRLRAGATQREVATELGVSVTTVSRGARQLRYGTGGFEAALSRPRRRP